MTPDAPLEIRLLRALSTCERFLRMPACPPRDALETAARSAAVDVGTLAVMLLERSVARERARQAINADDSEIHARDA